MQAPDRRAARRPAGTPAVLDGGSDLLVEMLGDIAVEIEAVVQVAS